MSCVTGEGVIFGIAEVVPVAAVISVAFELEAECVFFSLLRLSAVGFYLSEMFLFVCLVFG